MRCKQYIQRNQDSNATKSESMMRIKLLSDYLKQRVKRQESLKISKLIILKHPRRFWDKNGKHLLLYLSQQEIKTAAGRNFRAARKFIHSSCLTITHIEIFRIKINCFNEP